MKRPTIRSRASIITAVIAMGALLAAILACSGESDSSSGKSITQLPEPQTREVQELDKPLMIALAQTKNFHHKADVYLGEGKFGEAITAVRQILSIPFPDDAPEAEDVTLDARARLAKLLVIQGDIDEALSIVDRGIASATRRSFFLANLYTAKGEVYEAKAKMIEQDGSGEPDPQATAQARAAKRKAIEAFDESIAINRDLQEALMGEDNR